MTQFEREVQEEFSRKLEIPSQFEEISVQERDDFAEKQQIVIYQMPENSIILAAPTLAARIEQEVQPGAARISRTQVKDSLNLSEHEFGDKTVYLFLPPGEHKQISPEEGFSVSQLDSSHEQEFARFISDCPEEEVNEALVSLEDPVVFGCFHRDKLVGATSYWFWGERLADVGVIIHPDYRGRGIGKVLISRISKWGIENNRINLYRHEEKNYKSHKLGLAMNYKVHFTEEPMSI